MQPTPCSHQYPWLAFWSFCWPQLYTFARLPTLGSDSTSEQSLDFFSRLRPSTCNKHEKANDQMSLSFLLRTSQGGELLDLVDPSHHSHRIHLCTATPQLSCQYVARCNAPACILHCIPVMDMSAQNRPWPSNTSALDLRKAIRSSSRRSNSFGHTTDDTCADLTCYKSVYIDHSRTMRHLRTHCEFVGELLLKVSDPRLYVQTKAYLDMMGR